MIGSRLGSWILDKELGRGGMGCVYRAHAADPAANAPERAAVKVLAAELATEPGFLLRFQREIDVLRKLDHPNIVRFYESGRQDGHYFFAMEYVDGPSLQTLLHERGRLPWPEVLDLALQIAPALKHAHDRGVIHRDLKPSNLLCGATPAVPCLLKLTDFGIASLFAGKHLTVTGGVVGTAEYLSPEQAAGKPVSRRSDLYSLGAVLYTLLTGRTPFEGELLDLLHKHRFAQFDRPARLVPELPPDFDAIVCDLLAKDPARRPPDASVLARRLDSLRRKMRRVAQSTAEMPPPTVPDAGGARAAQPDPAALMSKLMREELEHQNRGGPVRQFFNRPAVLLALLAVTVSLIVWGFWPPSAETLFRRGAALMASPDPDDWDRAWDRYLGPLRENYPNHGHEQEMAEFQRRMDERAAERQAARAARAAGPMSEAQWFYLRGLRLRQQGDEEGARGVWLALIDSFKDVKTEAPWVKLAEQERERKGTPEERQWEPVRAALRHARQLREENKEQEADAIRRGLEQLYRDDPQALKILKE